MNIVGQLVFSKVFGNGTIINYRKNQIVVSFNEGNKTFLFPEAFDQHLKAEDNEFTRLVNQAINLKKDFEIKKKAKENREKVLIEKNIMIVSEKKARVKVAYQRENDRTNIAFKCTFCDGGRTEEDIGYNGVCSDGVIYNNIVLDKRIWCSAYDSPCNMYMKKRITRAELEEQCKNGGSVCYESQMLRDWRAFSGVAHRGVHEGEPFKIKKVKTNSLCVLTTRNPNTSEADRYIFAVFLVDESYKGDSVEAGYVATQSKFKIKLTRNQAEKFLFWKYHYNNNKSHNAKWGTGLFRYLTDEEAAQILKDISEVKKDTEDSELADEFFDYFCKIKGITSVTDPIGALTLK